MPGPQASRRRTLPRAYQGYDSQDIFPTRYPSRLPPRQQNLAASSVPNLAATASTAVNNAGSSTATAANAVLLNTRPPASRADVSITPTEREAQYGGTSSNTYRAAEAASDRRRSLSSVAQDTLREHRIPYPDTQNLPSASSGSDVTAGVAQEATRMRWANMDESPPGRDPSALQSVSPLQEHSGSQSSDRIGHPMEVEEYDVDSDEDDEDEDSDDEAEEDEDEDDEDNHNLEDDCDIGDGSESGIDPEDYMDFILGPQERVRTSAAERARRRNLEWLDVEIDTGARTSQARNRTALSLSHDDQKNDSDAPSDPNDDVNMLSSNEDPQPTTVHPANTVTDRVREVRELSSPSISLAGASREDRKEDNGISQSTSTASRDAPSRSPGLARVPLTPSSGSRLVSLVRSTERCVKEVSVETDHDPARRKPTIPRPPWVTPTSYLQPGIILDGLQTLCLAGLPSLSQSAAAVNGNNGNAQLSRRRTGQDLHGMSQGLLDDLAYHQSRFGIIPGDALPVQLEPLPESQIMHKEEWRVKVTMHAINMNRGTVEGFMEAVNVPHSAKSVITYFTGEVVDFVNHSLWTERWKSSRSTDLQYWRKLKPFEHMTESEIRKGLRSRKWLYHLCKDWVLMRWKEQSFINVRPAESGLTIDGFYYICLRRSDGMTEGLYFDPSSSPYQKLRLYPHFDTTGYSSSTWAYR